MTKGGTRKGVRGTGVIKISSNLRLGRGLYSLDETEESQKKRHGKDLGKLGKFVGLKKQMVGGKKKEVD